MASNIATQFGKVMPLLHGVLLPCLCESF